MLNDSQYSIISDAFATVGKFVLTSVPFGIVMSPSSMSVWVIIGVIMSGIAFIGIAVYLRRTKEDSKESTNITAEIKKGIFHVQNAEISASRET